MSKRVIFHSLFLAGLVFIAWMGLNFSDSDPIGLTMVGLIAITFIVGFWELKQFRRATSLLQESVRALKSGDEKLDPDAGFEKWLAKLDPSLDRSVKRRVELGAGALPMPVITPYLVGLLVMLGLIGTFAGMVGTLKGAVYALEGTSELQAIRAGLAAPIKGLGLAFGTSVAGVAASAILGLMSTISRRERLQAGRMLDDLTDHVLQPFTLGFHQMESHRAAQTQLTLLPELVNRVELIALNMEQMGNELAKQMGSDQKALQQSVVETFEALSTNVGKSLHASLANSGDSISRSLTPIFKTFAENMSSSFERTAQNMADKMSSTSLSVLESSAQSFTDDAKAMASSWRENIQTQMKNSDQLVANFEQQKDVFVETFTARAQAQNDAFATTQEAWFKRLTDAEFARLEHVDRLFSDLICQLSDSLDDVQEDSVKRHEKLLTQSEALIESRVNHESRWLADFNERMGRVHDEWVQNIAEVKEQESERVRNVIGHIEGLEVKVEEHLGRLGAGLEEPMTRLIETASETPKAAADVIGKLKKEMVEMAQRENNLIKERAELLSQLQGVSANMERSTQLQQEAIERLVNEAGATLKRTEENFSQEISGDLNRLHQASEDFSVGAADVASLGDAFGAAVISYGDSNDKLLASLANIEASLDKVATRSDEQLGYYIAQARELIDYSLVSQKELFDKIQLISKGAEEPA